jgi:hypothetical protein
MVKQISVAWLLAAIGFVSVFAAVPTSKGGFIDFPAINGGPVRTEATVVYTSDGYRLNRCLQVGTTGNAVADAQACKTVNFRRTSEPISASTSVWMPPSYEGMFVAPRPKSNPSSWFGLSDNPDSDLRGTIIIRIDLDKSGKILRCVAAEGRGTDTLDRLVQKVFCSRARYKAATLDGAPVASVTINVVRITNGD